MSSRKLKQTLFFVIENETVFLYEGHSLASEICLQKIKLLSAVILRIHFSCLFQTAFDLLVKE